MASMHHGHTPASTMSTPRTLTGKRKSHAKSKSGCRTCKLRRVRCDETRPKCRNCERLELDCDGYLPLDTCNPTATLSALEGRSFQYFHSQTRPQLGSWPEHNFWNQLAPQRSYSEESIRQIVIAIGAFHESLEVSGSNRIACENNADRLYQRAISKMMAGLPQMPIADLLLGTILLAFLDNIRGDERNAFTHVSGASAIVEEYRAVNASQSWLVTKVLAPMIDHMAALFHSWYAPPSTLSFRTDLDEPYCTYLDAYDHLSVVVDDLVDRLRATDPTIFPEDMVCRRLDSWWDNFTQFSDRMERIGCQCDWPYCNAHHRLAALYFEILFMTARARLHSAFTGLETTLDLYEDVYRGILDACEQIAHILRTSPDMDITARNCLGFLPVYLTGCWTVAVECRDPSLRRRAVSVLRRWHRVDALYDTFLVADTAECIINREERSSLAQPVTSSRDLPEVARIRPLNTSFFALDSKTGTIAQVYEAARCDYIKVSVLRRIECGMGPDIDLRAVGNSAVIIEALWVERPSTSTTKSKPGYRFPPSGMPIATGGLFPQAAAPPSSGQTKLWSRVCEMRSAEELLEERRWKIVNPPLDRIYHQADSPDYRNSDDMVKVDDSGRQGRLGRLPAPSTPLEKRAMGTYLRAIVHDVC